jgi:hypothetical protein
VAAFTSPELRKGFKLVTEIEPQLRLGREFEQVELPGFVNKLLGRTIKTLAKGVTTEDIMGVEIMKKLFPKEPFEYTKELTKGTFLEAGIKPRKAGDTALAGERVFFTDEFAKKFNVAAAQGILRITEDANGFQKASVEVFDKAISNMRELPYDQVSKYVEAIFPVTRIEEELLDNIDELREFMVGAEAGIVGFTAKEFKKNFNLGSRFFSQLPTTSLVQSPKGYTPETGYGEIPIKADWPEMLDQYFFKPMSQYGKMLEQLEKVKLGEVDIDAGTLRTLKEYQDIIKNNQVAVQYMAVFADLEKVLAEGTRVLQENLAAERVRYDYLTQTAGLLQGLPKDLKEIDFGIKDIAELSAQQLMAFVERGRPEQGRYLTASKNMRELDMRRESLVSQMAEIQKAIIAVREISAAAEAFGVKMSPEEQAKYFEPIVKTGDKASGMLVAGINEVASNTATTNAILTDVESVLRGSTAPEKEVSQADLAKMSSKQLMEFVARTERSRLEAIKKGDTEAAQRLDKTLSNVVTVGFEKFGVERSFDLADQLAKGTGSALQYLTPWSNYYKGEKAPYAGVELARRGMGVSGGKEFIDAMEQVSPGISKTPDFQALLKLQEDNNKATITDNKTLQQLLALYSLSVRFDKIGTDRTVEHLQKQIKTAEKTREDLVASGGGTTVIDEELGKLRNDLTRVEEVAREQMFKQLIGPLALASEEMAKQLGISERTTRYLGVGATTLYAGAKLYETMTGGEVKVPEKLQKAMSMAQERASKGFGGSFYEGVKNVLGVGDQAALMAEIRKEEERKGQPLTKEELAGLQKRVEAEAKKAEEKPTKNIFQEVMSEFRKERETRATTAADKMLNATEDQNSILLGIYEKTTEVADNTTDFAKGVHKVAGKERAKDKEIIEATKENVKAIRDEYSSKTGVGFLTKAIFAGLATGAVGYVKDLSSLTNVINSMSGSAKKELDLMRKIIKERRTEVVAAVKARQVKALETAGAPPEMIEKISRVLDTGIFEEKVVEALTAQLKALGLNAQDITSAMKELSSTMSPLPATLAKGLIGVEREARFGTAAYRTQMAVPPAFGDLFKAGFEEGTLPEVVLPKRMKDLSAMEASVAAAREGGNRNLEDEIMAYKELTTMRQGLKDFISNNSKEIFKLEESLSVLKDTTAESSSQISTLESDVASYTKANEMAKNALEKINSTMKTFASTVIQANVFGTLLQDFRRMKDEYKSTEALEAFKKLGEGFDMILGGSHPLAPQWPTFEAFKAGIPMDKLFKMDKYQMMAAEIVGGGKSLMPEDRARINFAKKIDLMRWAQAKEDEKLQRHRAVGEKYFGMLYEARRGAETIPDEERRAEAIAEIDRLQKVLEYRMQEAPKIMTAYTGEGLPYKRYTGLGLGEEESKIKSIVSQLGISDQMLAEAKSQTGALLDIRTILETMMADSQLQTGSWIGPVGEGSRMMLEREAATQAIQAREQIGLAGTEPVEPMPTTEVQIPTPSPAARKQGTWIDKLRATVAENEEMRRQIFEEIDRKNIEETEKRFQEYKNQTRKTLDEWLFGLEPGEGLRGQIESKIKEDMAQTREGIEYRKALFPDEPNIVKVEAKYIGMRINEAFNYIKDTANAWADALMAAPEPPEEVRRRVTIQRETAKAAENPDTSTYQVGGTITGPGGPREDKVPILASPGEFVVKASSAKKLGKSALDYINERGEMPRFARGGFVRGFANGGYPEEEGLLAPTGMDPWTYNPNEAERDKIIRENILAATKQMPAEAQQPLWKQITQAPSAISAQLGENIKALESERLAASTRAVEGAAEGKAGQWGVNTLYSGVGAAGELTTRLIKGFADLGSLVGAGIEKTIEGAQFIKSDIQSKGLVDTFKGYANDAEFFVSDIGRKLGRMTTEDIKGGVRTAATGVYSAIAEDISKGGLGTTAGIIEALWGAKRVDKLLRNLSGEAVEGAGETVTKNALTEVIKPRDQRKWGATTSNVVGKIDDSELVLARAKKSSENIDRIFQLKAEEKVGTFAKKAEVLGSPLNPDQMKSAVGSEAQDIRKFVKSKIIQDGFTPTKENLGVLNALADAESLVGTGTTAITFLARGGKEVIKVRAGRAPKAPLMPDLINPTLSKGVYKTKYAAPVTVTRHPYLKTFDEDTLAGEKLGDMAAANVSDMLKRKGYTWSDARAANVGIDPKTGRFKALDEEFIDLTKGTGKTGFMDISKSTDDDFIRQMANLFGKSAADELGGKAVAQQMAPAPFTAVKKAATGLFSPNVEKLSKTSTKSILKLESYIKDVKKSNPFLEKVSFKNIDKAVLEADDPRTAIAGIKEMVDMANTMTSRLGKASKAKTIDFFDETLTDIDAYPKEPFGVFSKMPKKEFGRVGISPRVWKDTKGFIDAISLADPSYYPKGAALKPFAFLMAHEKGHAFFPRDTLESEDMLRLLNSKVPDKSKTTVEGLQAWIKSNISGHAANELRESSDIGESFADIVATSFLGQRGKVSNLIESYKDLFGISYKTGGLIPSFAGGGAFSNAPAAQPKFYTYPEFLGWYTKEADKYGLNKDPFKDPVFIKSPYYREADKLRRSYETRMSFMPRPAKERAGTKEYRMYWETEGPAKNYKPAQTLQAPQPATAAKTDDKKPIGPGPWDYGIPASFNNQKEFMDWYTGKAIEHGLPKEPFGKENGYRQLMNRLTGKFVETNPDVLPERFNNYQEFMGWYSEQALLKGLPKEPFGKDEGYKQLIAKFREGYAKEAAPKPFLSDEIMTPANKAVMGFKGPVSVGGSTASRDPGSGRVVLSNVPGTTIGRDLKDPFTGEKLTWESYKKTAAYQERSKEMQKRGFANLEEAFKDPNNAYGFDVHKNAELGIYAFQNTAEDPLKIGDSYAYRSKSGKIIMSNRPDALNEEAILKGPMAGAKYSKMYEDFGGTALETSQSYYDAKNKMPAAGADVSSDRISIGTGKDAMAAIKQDSGQWLLTNKPELMEEKKEEDLYCGGGMIKRLLRGGLIPSYAVGTPYVPNDQLAMLHKGEAVIPEQYNQPAGNLAKEILNAGADFGKQIAAALSGVEVKAVLETDTVKLDTDTVSVDTTGLVDGLNNVRLQVEEVRISNVDEISESLKSALASIQPTTGAVGADQEDKLTSFMEEMRDKLDRQDSRMVEKSDEFGNKITEVNTAKETLEKELEDLKVLMGDLKAKTDNDYTKAEKSSDSAAGRSEFEARLVELMADFKSDELAPLKSQVFNMSSTLSTLDYNINKAMDLINTVSNRLSLTR